MLSQNQRRALDALLISGTLTEAAKKAGITRLTLRKYKADPEFAAAYNKASLEILESAKAQAASGLSPALDALRDIVIDERAQPAARVGAARCILEYSLRLCDYVDITRRIDELEKFVKEGENGGT